MQICSGVSSLCAWAAHSIVMAGDVQVSALPRGGCRVQHRLSVQPSLAPPEALATYTKKIFVRQVERLLEDLSRELWRIQAQS